MPTTCRPRIVVTGATSGLGRLAASELATRGADLVLVARSGARAAETRAEVLSSAPAANIDIVIADLTSMADVRRAGEQIVERFEQIDVLINNAGLHAFQPRITHDGYPEMVAVNYLAPWLLTRTVLPALTRTDSARVVTVASEASRRHGTLHLPHDLTDTSTFSARGSSEVYGKTKLLDIMFSAELARRTSELGISSNCLDPGFNVTGLGRELRFAAPLERVLRALRIGDPARGSGLIVKLATSPEFEQATGAYVTVKNTRQIAPAAPANDPALQRQLWLDTERLLADF